MKQLNKNNIIDGEFTEVQPTKESKSFWKVKLPNWFTIPLFTICMMFVIHYQHDFYSSYIEENEQLKQDNWEMKHLVLSCKCRDCKITLKTIRGLYVYNKSDSVLFNL